MKCLVGFLTLRDKYLMSHRGTSNLPGDFARTLARWEINGATVVVLLQGL